MYYTNSSMFIIKIQGNLGSQLWQYAFGQFLQKKHNKKAIYDIAAFSQQSTNNFLLSKILSHKITTINSSKNIFWKYKLKKYNYFKETHPFTYDKQTLTIKDNTIFDGYFQHSSYLKPIEKELHNSIKKNSLPKKYVALKTTHTLVALHISRENKNNKHNGLQGNCDLEYYYQALEKIQKTIKNPYVLIFTNDMDWTKKNFTPSCKHEYMTHNKSSHEQIIHDFFLMQLCEHFIISNSSFSYWVAYLGSAKKPQIITPYFFNYEYNTISKKVVPSTWHVLEHTFCSKKIKPMVSIIIPVYNVEKYLARCLESACNQSLKEIEIIVVNDCTPDNSEKIILQYMKRDSRIKYIKHQKNLGLGGARNTGVKKATADWLLFLDSDDWIHQDTAEITLKKALSNKANIVYFGMYAIPTNVICYKMPKKETNLKNPLISLLSDTPFNISVCLCDKLWHKNLFIKNNITFPTNFLHEDLATTPKLLYHAKTMLAIPHLFYLRELAKSDSITASSFTSRCKFHAQSINIIHNYLKKKSNNNQILMNNLEKFALLLINIQINHINSANSIDAEKILNDCIQNHDIYIHLFLQKYIENCKSPLKNYWYKFGQLSKKQKIVKVIQFSKKKLLNYLIRSNKSK